MNEISSDTGSRNLFLRKGNGKKKNLLFNTGNPTQLLRFGIITPESSFYFLCNFMQYLSCLDAALECSLFQAK